MRILQLVSGMHVNGAVLQCLALTRALADRGHEVALACRPGSWISQQLAGTNITVLHSHLRRWPMSDATELADFARGAGIELLHTHQSRAHVCGLLIRLFSGIPSIATAHCRHLQPHWCLHNFVIANSEATYRFHHRWNWVPHARLRVVHYLLDLARFEQEPAASGLRLRQAWGLDPEHRVAGVIGDLIPRKGQLHLVRAWPQVLRQVPQARLVMVGCEKDPAYVARVRSEMRALGVEEQVRFAGYQTDMPAVMQAIDLCVSAATEEALGLTVPEAMAARKAVVATRVGGLPENVWEGETGLLVPRSRPKAMAKAVATLLGDDRKREDFARAGYDRVHAKYAAEEHLREVEAIYARVAGRGPKGCVGRPLPAVRPLVPTTPSAGPCA